MAETQRRVCLITGSTSGIGLAISKGFASNGYDVILTGICEPETIGKILQEFKQNYDGECTYIDGDFRNEVDIHRICQEIVKQYPDGIDILINNAGFQHVAPVDEYPINIWHDMVAVHLTSAFLFIRFFLPYMKKKGWCRIVNTSSQNSLVGVSGKAPYNAVKAGLIGLGKGTALETASFGITCNCICPGLVETELTFKQLRELSEKQKKSYEDTKFEFYERNLITRKPVTLEQVQVVGLVNYLCSDEAASTTGTAIPIDTGFTAQ